MKITKKLLKEIIRQECNMLLCEGAIADVLIPAINKFNDKITSNTKSPHYPISYETFDIMSKVIGGEMTRQEAIQSISKIGTTGTYNKLLKGALDSFIKFKDDYDKGKFNSQAINTVSTNLNMATKNYDNVKALNQKRNVYTDDTIDFEPAELAGATRVR